MPTTLAAADRLMPVDLDQQAHPRRVPRAASLVIGADDMCYLGFRLARCDWQPYCLGHERHPRIHNQCQKHPRVEARRRART